MRIEWRISGQCRIAVVEAALSLSALPVFAQRLITTVAGTDWVVSANGKQALNVPLSQKVLNVALDTQGNLYIPDPLNEVVFMVRKDGVTQVVAGNGIAGFSGDKGAATSASLNYPTSVAIDGAGNLYIADANNYRIRVVGPDGVITTFAGTGSSRYSGDGGPAALASFGYVPSLTLDPSNNLIVCDQGNQRVRRTTPTKSIMLVFVLSGGATA